MAITEQEEVNIMIRRGKFLEVERISVFMKDGAEVGRQKHRVAYSPGDEMQPKDAADENINAIKQRFWTPEVIEKYKKEKEEKERNNAP